MVSACASLGFVFLNVILLSKCTRLRRGARNALEITVCPYLQNFQLVPVKHLGVADTPGLIGKRTELKSVEWSSRQFG